MQAHFVASAMGANGKPIYFVDKDEAFALAPSQMDQGWVEKYGCADLGPPPATKSMERNQLKIKEICEACDAPLPPTFVDRPHQGGASCPCCAFVAVNQGFAPMTWFLHPGDRAAPQGQAPKPAGRKNGYIHQIMKCGYGLAMAHVIVRRDRDAGRGDANAHLFERRPA